MAEASYEVVWTKTALQDLDDIGDYIALDSPRAAENIVRRIVEAIDALTQHPNLGRIGRVDDTRELIVSDTPYIAVYRVTKSVEILTIFHAFRKWPEVF